MSDVTETTWVCRKCGRAHSGSTTWIDGGPTCSDCIGDPVVLPQVQMLGPCARCAELEKSRDKALVAAAGVHAENKRLQEALRDIASWRAGADEHDADCGNPKREYCEDVELIERAAKGYLRASASSAYAHGGKQ